ncbi:hypothetical protein HEP89_08805 [Labrenzia sp. 5N]|uniref:hypothetical protein n=1 Tax=Labrenzia sp. 5N TaxID=2723402 RepID=UPI00144766FB|nr:hypothetical protein [Labrenzia sp. 5N]NKX64201.1 hypothetical protein [Labrenzia sp. 5N]
MANTVEPLDVNPRLVHSVGMIAIQWARIEFTFQKILIAIIDADGAAGLMLTSNLGNRTISDFVKTYASEIKSSEATEDYGSELTLLANEFDRLLGIRNRIVHNTWPQNLSDEQAVALVVRFKGKSRVHEEVWDLDAIALLVQDIVDYLDSLTRFAVRYDLFKPMHSWEQRTTSTRKPSEPR